MNDVGLHIAGKRSPMHARWAAALLLAMGLIGAAGRAQEAPTAAHFHHVGINATDPAASIEFYRKVFGAVPVKYAGTTEALFCERSFFFFRPVESAPPSSLSSTIWHLGWGGIDGPNEYAWWKAQGVRFDVDLTQLGTNYYMYLLGPDDERIEIYTGEKSHRFNHVHLLATDVNVTTRWFVEHLGLTARREGNVEPVGRGGYLLWSNSLRVDNVSIVVFGLGDPDQVPPWWPPDAKVGKFAPTRGRVVDHLGFSYREIEPVHERMQRAGVEIVEPLAERDALGGRSFFVMAPDGLLVEIVEAGAIPDSSWE